MRFLGLLILQVVLTAVVWATATLVWGEGLSRLSDLGGAFLIASAVLLLAGLIKPSLFAFFVGRRATRPRLSAWFIFLSVAMLVIVIAKEGNRNLLYGATFFTGARPQPIEVTFPDEAGQAVAVMAYPGQIILAVAPDTSLMEARALLRTFGGRLIARIPLLGIYLVEVPAGAEATVIANARANPKVTHASPNLVLEAAETPPVDLTDKGVNPAGMVPALISGTTLSQKIIMAQLDNFLTSSHGEDVRTTRESITGSADSLRIHIGGLPCGRMPAALCSSSDQSLNGLAAIIAGAELNQQKVTINLSWGPVPPQTTNEAQFTATGASGANAWALPAFETYYRQLMTVLQASEWAQAGNVLVNKSAGNGVVLVKAGAAAGNGGVDLNAALDRLATQYPDVMGKSMVFCGALAGNGSRAAYSNFGRAVIFAPVAASKPGTSFAAPQCWGASYNAWNENQQLSAAQIAKAMAETAKPNAHGLAVLDPAGVRSALQSPVAPAVPAPTPPRSTPPAKQGPTCHGKIWPPCPKGYKFYCPPEGGEPSCNPEENTNLCNGQWWPPCTAGYTWSCTARGGECTPIQIEEKIEEAKEEVLPPPPLPPTVEPSAPPAAPTPSGRNCDAEQVVCLERCDALPAWPAEPKIACINDCGDAARRCYAGQ